MVGAHPPAKVDLDARGALHRRATPAGTVQPEGGLFPPVCTWPTTHDGVTMSRIAAKIASTVPPTLAAALVLAAAVGLIMLMVATAGVSKREVYEAVLAARQD